MYVLIWSECCHLPPSSEQIHAVGLPIKNDKRTLNAPAPLTLVTKSSSLQQKESKWEKQGDLNHLARSGGCHLNLQWWDREAVNHVSKQANQQPQDVVEGQS